jgi:hypothetical protein
LLRRGISARFTAALGQKPALPRRSIGVRFALNKQTLTERVQCDAMCHNRTNAPQQKSHHSITVDTREQHGRRYGTASTIFRSTSVS